MEESSESDNLGMSESVKYTYDANGNLLRESAARYRKDYVYNAQNRMSFSDVQDSVLNTRNFTEYVYDAFVLQKRLSYALGITEDQADNLFLAIMNYGASYFTNCLANPLIIQALKTLKIKPKELNLARDVKDFILMNIDWMKKGK